MSHLKEHWDSMDEARRADREDGRQRKLDHDVRRAYDHHVSWENRAIVEYYERELARVRGLMGLPKKGLEMYTLYDVRRNENTLHLSIVLPWFGHHTCRHELTDRIEAEFSKQLNEQWETVIQHCKT